MSELQKKEIIDYLRNQQKAAEIEAKVNGVNLWVIAGAIAVTSWMLINAPIPDAPGLWDACARLSLCGSAIHLFFTVQRRSKSERTDLRFAGIDSMDVQSPIIAIIFSAVFLTPSLAAIYINWRNAGAWIIFAFGFGLFMLSIFAIKNELRCKSKISQELPKPMFNLTYKNNLIGDLIIFTLCTLSIANQIIDLAMLDHPRDVIKCALLASVAYTLLLILIRKLQFNQSTQWSYELETDLVIGIIQPPEALKRIEKRELGSKLEDVMDKLLASIEAEINETDSALSQSKSSIELMSNEIPAGYTAGRSAELEKAIAPLREKVNCLQGKVDQLGRYIIQLDAIAAADTRLHPAVTQLKTKHNDYAKKTTTYLSYIQSLSPHATQGG